MDISLKNLKSSTNRKRFDMTVIKYDSIGDKKGDFPLRVMSNIALSDKQVKTIAQKVAKKGENNGKLRKNYPGSCIFSFKELSATAIVNPNAKKVKQQDEAENNSESVQQESE